MSSPLVAHDVAFMRRALQLAEAGRCSTTPNPRVGCVLVRDGRTVGEGFHHHAGGPHAERVALAAAGGAARGATAYVTLEPCCHHGRTPPCTDGLIEAGVVRVVYADGDSNPRVAGGGVRQLEAAGIAVIGGVLSSTVLTLLVVPVVFVQMERFSSFVLRMWHIISPPVEDEELQTRPMNPEANVSGDGSEGAAK